MNMKRLISILFLLGSGVLLAGCASISPTFLVPNSMVSLAEANLFIIILVMAAVVFLLVWSLLIYNALRFRRKKGDDDQEPPQKYGNWRLEFVWTAIPVLLVLILFVFTVTTMNATASPNVAKQADVNVHVIGHQWWWEFEYPDAGFTTANELHVPVGTPVMLTLNSEDVIHSFWVPQLSHKIDVIPGQTNHLWFQADHVGVFHGHCAEFCGQNHANMRIVVVVQSAQDYAAWLKNQQQPPYQPVTDQEKEGQLIITQGVCNSCHTLGDNKAANEGVAPNLTHLMSRSEFAGATYQLTPDNLHSWLENTQAMKPGNDMIVALSNDQIDALIAYLTKLK